MIEPQLPSQVSAGSECLLLVEDEDAVRMLLKSSLERLGYRILATSSAVDAVDLMQAHRLEIRLLIVDMVMPEKPGAELASELKRFSPGLKVIFISGYSDDFTADNSHVLEADAFLQKPFLPTTLATIVRQLLDLSIGER